MQYLDENRHFRRNKKHCIKNGRKKSVELKFMFDRLKLSPRRLEKMIRPHKPNKIFTIPELGNVKSYSKQPYQKRTTQRAIFDESI